MPLQCCIDRWERLLKEDPDMPVFTLLGKDILAIETVEYWIRRARVYEVNEEKLRKVQLHLDALKAYAAQHQDKMQVPD